MKIKQIFIGIASCALFLIAASGLSQAEEQRFVTIGTGGVTGVYYPTGGAICRLLNKGRKDHGIRCSVESTGGSVYNINTIRSEELDIGVVQSDWQYHAYYGTSSFEKSGAFKELRAVFGLHVEPVTVLARSDSNIKELPDLKGKRVNIGNPGSGTRATALKLLEAIGWNTSNFTLVAELRSVEIGQALCDNKLDAFIQLVGHPSGYIKEATSSCDTNLVAIKGPVIDKLVESESFYVKAIIPGGMYRGSTDNVSTYGVRATLVSSTNTPDEVIYQLVKAVFENFAVFKKMHPAFANFDEKNMIKGGLSAPLHQGAIRYYKERGWM